MREKRKRGNLDELPTTPIDNVNCVADEDREPPKMKKRRQGGESKPEVHKVKPFSFFSLENRQSRMQAGADQTSAWQRSIAARLKALRQRQAQTMAGEGITPLDQMIGKNVNAGARMGAVKEEKTEKAGISGDRLVCRNRKKERVATADTLKSHAVRRLNWDDAEQHDGDASSSNLEAGSLSPLKR